ncbi:MAG: hypothetical protein ACI88H_002962 [Cocleimonas sp.]|jgi:hypothetical protein
MKLDWDHYSDQPAVIKDRALKKQIYKQVRWDSLKMLLTNVVMYPICLINYLLFSIKKIPTDIDAFFGISINLDKNPKQTQALINDLGVNNLLIRMPLSDIENIEKYFTFAKQYQDKNLLINILQDRRHIEDSALLKNSLEQVFTKFSSLTDRFQLGNAINRKKWAIFSMDEFLRFYKVGFDLRNEKFPDIKLLGSSVIDFEYYFSIRTLFNLYKIRFDQFSSLLYVDRRGAPENTQMGLDLTKKLHLMQSMLRISPKSSNEIVITEANWPISNTAPYAPTSENDCVDLETHANFLVRYYLLALASNVVKNVYWHQLIAPGYGLIDNRNDELIKYPAYQAFKVMLNQLQGTTFANLIVKEDIYTAKFLKQIAENNSQLIEVIWSTKNIQNSIDIDPKKQQIVLQDGSIKKGKSVKISESPIYLITNQTNKNINQDEK